MNRTKSILLAATALATLTIAGQASAQTAPGVAVVFLPQATPVPIDCPSSGGRNTIASAISADGTIVAGESTNIGRCLVRWINGVPTLEGQEAVSNPNFQGIASVYSISGDGRVVVGVVSNSINQTAYWTATQRTQFFPDPATARAILGRGYVNSDGTYFALNSRIISPSSSVPVGSRVAYRWSPTGGYENIGSFGANWDMVAFGISGSGSVIVGSAFVPGVEGGRAFVWRAGIGLAQLPDLATAPLTAAVVADSEANAVSRDGTTIVGQSTGNDGVDQAVYWRNGVITGLGYIPGTSPANFQTNALATNADGSVIVGSTFSAAERTGLAWRWSVNTGMQDINVIARNAGLNLNGFVLTEAVGVSDNGQFIIGNSFNSAQNVYRGFVLQLAQVTQSRLIVTIRLPGVTQTSIVNQTFNTQVDALLNGANVFTRTVTDPINGAGGVTALADARAALQVGSGLRRVVIGAPTLLSNVTTVLGTTNNTVDVASGTTTSTATINTFGPATVITGDLGICATGVVGSSAPTGCSQPGKPVTVDAGILNSNVYTQTNNSVIPTTTQTVNQLITARWQIAATAGNQFGTVHALVGPAAFERGDRLVGQLLGMEDGDASAASGITRAAMPVRDESGLGGGESSLTMFGGYFGSRSSIDADASIPVARVKGNSDGFVLGLQQALGDSAHIGIALDHGSSDYTVRDPLYPETLKLKHTQAALFAGWSDGGFSLSGAASYGFGTARTSLLTPTTPATGSRDINSWSLGAQAGYAVALGKDASLTPHIGIRHTSAKLKRFTEAGGPTPLLGLSQTVDRTRLYAGLEAKAGINLGGLTLTPNVYGRIARDSGDASGTADLVFASAPGGPVMQALGPGVGKTVTELGGSLDAAVGGNVHLWAGYDGTFRDHDKTHSAKVGLTIAF